MKDSEVCGVFWWVNWSFNTNGSFILNPVCCSTETQWGENVSLFKYLWTALFILLTETYSTWKIQTYASMEKKPSMYLSLSLSLPPSLTPSLSMSLSLSLSLPVCLLLYLSQSACLPPCLSLSHAVMNRWSYISASPTPLQRFISSLFTQKKKGKGKKEQGCSDRWRASAVSETERDAGSERGMQGHGWREKQSSMPVISVYTPRQMEMKV